MHAIVKSLLRRGFNLYIVLFGIIGIIGLYYQKDIFLVNRQDPSSSNENSSELQSFIIKSLSGGASGIRYGCGKENIRNGYDCGSSMDQASMIQLYTELYARTKEEKFKEEALKFALSGNSTCGPKTGNSICGEGKQQGEMILANLKLYLVSKNPKVKEVLLSYLSVPPGNIVYYTDTDRVKLAQAYATAYYFLGDPVYLKNFSSLENEITMSTIPYVFIQVIKSFYINKNPQSLEKELPELIKIISKADQSDWYILVDMFEIIEMEKNNPFPLLLNVLKKQIESHASYGGDEIGNYMMFGRMLLLSCKIPEQNKKFSILLQKLEKEIIAGKQKDAGKHYAYADEGDNFAPFFLGLYHFAFDTSYCPSWNIDTSLHYNYNSTSLLQNFSDDIVDIPPGRDLFLLLKIKKIENTKIYFSLYLKNTSTKTKRISPVFDTSYISIPYDTDIPKILTIDPEKESELLFSVDMKNPKFINPIFYGLYFIDESKNPYYLDVLDYPTAISPSPRIDPDSQKFQ